METSILYVDSDRSRFEVVQKELTAANGDMELVWAGSGVPATIILARDRFDCAICSQNLQDIEGVELLRRLRSENINTPFILIADEADLELEKQAIALGAEAFISREDLGDNHQALTDVVIRAVNLRDYEYQDEKAIDILRTQASFFQINPAPVLQADASGIILNCNPVAEEVFGSNLRGSNITEFFAGFSIYDLEVIRDFGLSQIEQKVANRTFLFTFRTDHLNNLLYLFATEITQRIESEEELRQAHQDNEMLLASITNVLIAVDSFGLIRQWNSIAEEVFGFGKEFVKRKTLLDCGINWRDEKFIKLVPTLDKITEPIRLESLRFRKVDESEIYLSVIVSPIKKEDGSNDGYLLLADNITERKLLEDQLSQAQKLEAIGQLAAGIAHEINTPTQYIGDNTHFINDSFLELMSVLGEVQNLIEGDKSGADLKPIVNRLRNAAEDADINYLADEIPVALTQSLEGIKRVTDIVRAMKEFSHPGSAEKKLIDINNALNSTITVARNEWKYVADVETDFDDTVPPVPCLAGELNQVFLNIITNASHAIADIVGDASKGKGKISISTLNEGKMVLIRITDTGGGIPGKIRKKVFDPFFTTKEIGKGTGQGLAISYNVIVEKHKGLLNFESEEGKGTTFLIRLPLEDPDVSPEGKE